jgi:hypothetical protein
MDQALRAVIDMNEMVWNRLKEDLKDLPAEEVNWRPLPQANNINLVVRHLRIEAQWKLASLERGEPEPTEKSESVQQFIDSIGFDYERNLKELDDLCTRFVAILRGMEESTLLKRNQLANGESARAPHFLSFHHPMHLVMHHGQIRTIRTLYRKTRGEPVPTQFYPDNPSYPRADG